MPQENREQLVKKHRRLNRDGRKGVIGEYSRNRKYYKHTKEQAQAEFDKSRPKVNPKDKKDGWRYGHPEYEHADSHHRVDMQTQAKQVYETPVYTTNKEIPFDKIDVKGIDYPDKQKDSVERAKEEMKLEDEWKRKQKLKEAKARQQAQRKASQTEQKEAMVRYGHLTKEEKFYDLKIEGVQKEKEKTISELKKIPSNRNKTNAELEKHSIVKSITAKEKKYKKERATIRKQQTALRKEHGFTESEAVRTYNLEQQKKTRTRRPKGSTKKKVTETKKKVSLAMEDKAYAEKVVRQMQRRGGYSQFEIRRETHDTDSSKGKFYYIYAVENPEKLKEVRAREEAIRKKNYKGGRVSGKTHSGRHRW